MADKSPGPDPIRTAFQAVCSFCRDYPTDLPGGLPTGDPKSVLAKKNLRIIAHWLQGEFSEHEGKPITVSSASSAMRAVAEACRTASVFFCHAVEWNTDIPREPDGSGEPGAPTDLHFDPFSSKLFVAYHRYTTAPWLAEVKEVKLVAAAERAEELHQPLTAMKAAYYYRFQLTNIQPAPTKNVSALVHHRPGKPTARLLSEFASCTTIPNTPETWT